MQKKKYNRWKVQRSFFRGESFFLIVEMSNESLLSLNIIQLLTIYLVLLKAKYIYQKYSSL